MTLEQLHDEWANDAPYDLSRLEEAARNVPMLHAKYWRLYSDERLRFKKADMDLKRLTRLRWEYWLGKLDDEQRVALGWPVQPLKILQANVDKYLSGDDVLQEPQQRVFVAEEKLRFLEDVIKHINKRGYDIKNSIDFLRFKNGQ